MLLLVLQWQSDQMDVIVSNQCVVMEKIVYLVEFGVLVITTERLFGRHRYFIQENTRRCLMECYLKAVLQSNSIETFDSTP